MLETAVSAMGTCPAEPLFESLRKCRQAEQFLIWYALGATFIVLMLGLLLNSTLEQFSQMHLKMGSLLQRRNLALRQRDVTRRQLGVARRQLNTQ